VITSHFLIPPGDLGTESTSGTFGLPQVLSESAAAFDSLYVVIVGFALLGAAIVGGRSFWLATKSKVVDDGDAPYVFWWAAAPAALLAVLFVWGHNKLIERAAPPGDAVDVRIEGKLGEWRVSYPESPLANSRINVEACHAVEGTEDEPVRCASMLTETDCASDAACVWDDKGELPIILVPKGVPARLLMTSSDRNYSMSIPALRQQRSVGPGKYSVLSFVAEEVGEFPVVNSGYLGASDPGMLAKLVVVEPSAFPGELKKLTAPRRDNMTKVQLGEAVFAEQGCMACHSITGGKLVGPPLNGIFGRDEKMADGATVTVDESYIKESILIPAAKIVDGFPAAMTPFEGKIDENELNGLVEYIKSLK